MTQSHLRPIDADLPDYPEELCDPRLTSDYFTMFWHDRWASSRLHLKASLAVQGAALNLFFLSRKQVPVGSLPDDEEMLCSLIRVNLDEWRGLMAQRITPLHNWSRYRYRNDIILGHSVVIEVAQDALKKREERKVSNEEKAVSQRQARLAGVMREMGCDKALCADTVLIGRLDAWLVENHRGQRRMPQFEVSVKRALEHAHQQRWLERGRRSP